jgi:ligand-binding sensor domain-containing protein/signal transduction histidine kinase/DNA-binding NarL/FixJ family response regulator
MRRLIVLFLLFLPFAPQAATYRPTPVLSTRNGLPTDAVKQIYQDKEGYIWIATLDGLCRYDGNSIKVYKSNLYTPILLSSNQLSTIAEDSRNQLWIGTNKGLNVLDKTTGKFRKINKKGLDNSIIQVILTTRNGNVWIGTQRGIYNYVAEVDSFIFFDNKSTDFRLRGNDVKTMIEDSNGNIWIGTWNGGLIRFDPRNGIFYPYPQINPQNSAHIIFEDNQQRIWVGSWDYGLFRLENPLDPDKVTYINYKHDKNRSGSLGDNIVYALSQDLNTGAIWVGTRSGLSILNDVNNPHSFSNHLPNELEWPLDELNSIVRDQSGLMWLGTLNNGVSIVNTTQSAFLLNPLDNIKNKMASTSVKSIYADSEGVVWMGIGSRGLASYNPATNNYVFYEDHPDFERHPIISSVNKIKQRGNAYWFATYGEGIFVYDPSLTSNKVKEINTQNHSWLKDDIINTLFFTKNNEVWIGTSTGLFIHNTQTGESIAYPYLGQIENGMRFSIIDIIEGNSNTLWIATTENGIFRVTRKPDSFNDLKFEHYSAGNNKLNNEIVQCIFMDSKGMIWAGTIGGGLNRYSANEDAFINVQQQYQMPGDAVFNMTEDKQGNLWMGTNAGLVVIKNGSAQQYTVADGLQNNSFNRNAIYQTAGGELFFGGSKGYNHFYPEYLQSNDAFYPTVITDIKIFNRSIDGMDDKIRKQISVKASGYTEKLHLPYNYNNFSIEFATLRYADSYRNKYAFMLDGFDGEWQYCNESKKFATYNNLKNGRYLFRLKSRNDDGEWQEEKKLQITILPPFWLTWWASLCYLIIAAIIAYLITKTSRNRLLIKNTIRVKDMEKQKIEELNQAKLQFFTNITHEFLTPLTILSASVDELKIISPQYNDFYKIMSININRLMRLFQQILEFRKAETGNLKLKVSQGDIAAFVNSYMDNFNPIMKKNKIHFSIICDPESIPAYFDHDKLDKILFNLLSNAAKYNKSGGFVQVNVGYYNPADKKLIRISVKDNGEGIQPSALKGLFKRFYDGDYRRYNNIGTGIGLSLTKDLVELHKGNISVESEVGKGSVFYIQIPINEEAYNENEIDNYTYAPQKAPLDAPENAELTEPDKKEHTLLLIEDNEELLQLMVKLLSREYNIFIARNGKEGIDLLETEFIDLIVSDIMMPEMDGIEFCKYVKNKFEISHVPIILLTAKNREEDRIDAYDSGADGFISKPFNLKVLYSKIKNLLKAKENMAKKFKKQFVFNIEELDYTSIDEDFLNRAVECIHKNIDDANFDQQKFADILGTSKSTLYKKLKTLTGLNSSSFIKNIRLKTACKIIKNKKTLRISELAYAVGFNDPKYFSSCFKKEFGLIPSEYLEKIISENPEKSND